MRHADKTTASTVQLVGIRVLVFVVFASSRSGDFNRVSVGTCSNDDACGCGRVDALFDGGNCAVGVWVRYGSFCGISPSAKRIKNWTALRFGAVFAVTFARLDLAGDWRWGAAAGLFADKRRMGRYFWRECTA